MDPITQGALISGASTIIGSTLSGRGSGSANRDRKMQKQFAQKGIRWRVADAEAAGLHPLAALGANISTPAPTSVFNEKSDYGIAQAGQQIGNALARRMTPEQKLAQAYMLRQEKAKAESYELDNQIKHKRMAELNNVQSGPSMDNFDLNVNPNSIFSGSQNDSGIITQPKMITAKKSPDTTAGQGAAYDDYMMGDYNVRTMNEKMAEATENDIVSKIRTIAIRGKEIYEIAAAYGATNDYKWLPGNQSKWHTQKVRNTAKQTIAKLRLQRKTLPKYKYRMWQMDPKLGWRSVPRTRTNAPYFFYGNKNPTPY